ncbi:choline-responsive transcriptional repressor BetI [Qingshengfaniella alkalisoli]|uniref:HTH-type transcriptional regulator BetI n=1 Tax=Qingshengfaniella alkalisoli TaxID=2599296 RepID=A0A5B8I9A7_9RHOB|nr:transcriptional regulator BetI [Qingshengfaniella alkalisoli]QDY70815.1 transcriptional regulator BetI [Qingshengfaniella alkalisoli]
MPKVGMEPIRKDALIRATITEIGRTGSLEVTVSQIARSAGMSSALAHHYFGSKNNLFLSSMRHILTIFGKEVRAEMAKVDDPRKRIEAIIRTSFSEQNFQPAVISAWLNFYVLAQKSDDATRLLRVYQRRLRSNLVAELRPLLGPGAPKAAQGIAALIDGIYIRRALRDEPLDPLEAEELVNDYLDLCLKRYLVT